MNSTVVTLGRVAALGLATGGRASAAFTALSWSASAADPALLSAQPVRIGTALMSAGESVGDKLPKAPSRLEPAGLAPRIVGGALAGALLSRRYGTAIALGSGVGAAAAFAGAHLGARWRKLANPIFGADLPGALIEDATVAGLATLATR